MFDKLPPRKVPVHRCLSCPKCHRGCNLCRRCECYISILRENIGVPSMVKVIQIAAMQVHGALTPTLYALNEDGDILERYNGIWKEIDLPRKINSDLNMRKAKFATVNSQSESSSISTGFESKLTEEQYKTVEYNTAWQAAIELGAEHEDAFGVGFDAGWNAAKGLK